MHVPASSRFAVAIAMLGLVGNSRADWPTYRNDAGRSGYTTQELSSPLGLRWSHRVQQPPTPAWPRSARMRFDQCFQPIIAEGTVWFGSSADGQIHALDSATGQEKWSTHTDGPVRFAPVYHQGKLYFGSDDGHLYCLSASTGTMRWKQRGGPDERLILGNGRMISRWPVRGGPVVRENTVYFAAGIWPSDGIYIYALDAETGERVWLNETAGSIYMGQPHGGAYADSGVAAQGYLAATDTQLFVPTGRSVPAAFDRATGAFQYFHLQENGHQGGSEVIVSDQFFINSGIAFDQASGAAQGKLGPGPAAAPPGQLLCTSGSGGELFGYDWIDTVKTDRRGNAQPVRGLTNRFRAALPSAAVSTVATPSHVVVGASNQVLLVDRRNGTVLWQAPVTGNAYGLAVSDRRLYVATDQGVLYSFDSEVTSPEQVAAKTEPSPYRPQNRFARAAEEIIARTGITNGYCVDLACEGGRLALELARRTELHIVALESDPQKAALARDRLTSLGLYGTRVTVLERDVAELPIYFANLVVAGASVLGEPHPEPPQRIVRPYGGVVCLGRPGALRLTTRGPLEGAGSWTHQYSDAANTTCSDDEHLKGPLQMLWFADVGQEMTQRHGRAPAPLFNNGILYSEGLDGIVAVDAYNGHTLWEYSIPGILKPFDGDHLMGTSGTGSNYCLSEDSLYVRVDDHCLRLDARTGNLLGTFNAPQPADGSQPVWGYIAYSDGVLYGSLANPEHVVTYRYLQGGDMSRQLTESSTLFALDPETGEPLWRYDAEDSIRHNSIAVAAGYVVLIDRPLALTDRGRGAKATNHETGELIGLYAGTGEVLWRNTNDIYGTLTAISPGHQKIIMGYQPTRFRLESELGGRISCFDLSTGEAVWERKSDYASRPMVNGDTVYAQGAAWDLFTGEDRPFNFNRSYGCGILAGAKELMVYRSATLGYFDLKKNERSQDYGGIRPGCWINVIPAGGLVFAPDASAGCVCSYPNQAWIALQPATVRPPALTPAARVAREPFTVQLAADLPGEEQVHYTLDGSTPTTNSPRYRDPLLIPYTTSLRARSFDSKGQGSSIVTADYRIAPDLIPLEDGSWSVLDAPGATPPSAWSARDTVVEQTANTFLSTPDALGKRPEVERSGTIRLFDDGADWADGEFALELQSDDDDGLGVVFRAQDMDRYYMWSAHRERGFRTLAVKDGDGYRLLASKAAAYEPGRWHQVRIRLDGPRIRVEVDGTMEFEVEDATFPRGTVGLYSWGNSGSRFRNLTFSNAANP